jgi:hypothetical protein
MHGGPHDQDSQREDACLEQSSLPIAPAPLEIQYSSTLQRQPFCVFRGRRNPELFIERKENVLALGNSGRGKTHIALALGLAACQKAYGQKIQAASLWYFRRPPSSSLQRTLPSREPHPLFSRWKKQNII